MVTKSSYFSLLSLPPSPPSLDSINRNISSVFDSLPEDLQSFASILSIKEKEALAYLIKWNSDLETQKQNFKKISDLYPHDPSFSCGCFECSSMFRGFFHDSDYYDHMSLILEDAIKQKNIKKPRKNKKRKKNQEQTSASRIQQHGLSGNGEVKLQSGGSNVIQQIPPERAVVIWPQVDRRIHMGFGRRIFPDVLGISNSRWWIRWHAIVQEEEEGNFFY